MSRRTNPQKQAIMPEGMKLFLRRRGDEVLGGFFFLIASYLLLSLITYDIADPSWNTAISGPAHNVGGPFGAIISDFFWQTLGWTSLLVVIIFFSWARVKISHKPLNRLWLKLALLPVLAVMGSLVAGAIPSLSSPIYSLSGSLGGTLATYIQSHLLFLGRHFAWLTTVLISLILFVPLVIYVSGIRGKEWTSLQKLLFQTLSFCAKGSWKLLSSRDKPFQRERDDFAREIKAPQMTINKPAVKQRDFEIDIPQAPIEVEEEVKEVAHFDLPDMQDYQLPPLDLLRLGDGATSGLSENELQTNAARLKEVLEDFGVRGDIVKVRPGPVVTLYELVPAPGIKSSRIIGLADDIARSMSAISARVAVIPGRNAIGIELPNQERETVFLRGLLASSSYERSGGSLPLALGKDISGAAIIADLARMPHLLVAGTTGSGKSVSVNSMILSLLYRLPPDRCKLIMIDPKMLELSVYDDIPHLLTPVVTDPKKAVVALKWTVREMENRYRAMSKLGVRNVVGYNMRISEAKAKGENLDRRVQTGFDPETGEPTYESQPLNLEPLPFIVVVVDEMADLMLVAGKDIESAVQRLAQMARAAGIHIIMATQRPSVDVITGTIKANFPTRISFQVTSKIDSRTILGEQGAEQLLGMGDMLYMAPGGRITRVHGPFVGDDEVEKIVEYLKSQGSPQYLEDILEDSEGGETFGLTSTDSGNNLYDQAVALIVREGKVSTSFIQRHLQIGYNRAAGIVEKMEQEGVVSPASRTGKREILIGNVGG